MNYRVVASIALTLAVIGGVYLYGTNRYKSGVEAERTVWQLRMAEAEEHARQATQSLQAQADAKEAQAVKFLSEQLEASRETSKQLEKSLGDMRNIRVPAAAVRVLNNATKRVPKDAGVTSKPSNTTTAVDSTLAEQLTVCQRNYQERYIPLANQLEQLQKLWNDTRAVINKD